MRETAGWIAALILGLLTPVQEYIIACEVLIILNWLAQQYTKKTIERGAKKRAPVYAQIFFVMVAIVATNQIDVHILKTNALSYPLSLALVIFEFNELQKSISEIIGFDLTKYTNKKNKDEKNEDEKNYSGYRDDRNHGNNKHERRNTGRDDPAARADKSNRSSGNKRHSN